MMEVTYIDGVTKNMLWEEFCAAHPGSEKHFNKIKNAIFEFGIYHGGGNGKEPYTLISKQESLREDFSYKIPVGKFNISKR